MMDTHQTITHRRIPSLEEQQLHRSRSSTKKTWENNTSRMTSNQQWRRSQQLNEVERSAQDHISGIIKDAQRVAPIIPKELSGDEAQGTTMAWSTQPNRHTETSVHPPLAGYIGYAALHEARLGSTYVELPTDPPQSTYVNFTHTQEEIPVDRQLAAQPLEGSQDSTILILAKLSHEEQWSLCE
jgi:hypothetical protein